MTYKLYDFPASPFCIKVRAILDYKGIAFERVDTAGTGMIELRKRSRIGKVPALDVGGELICDSTDIAYALEQRHPEPPILPADARTRALCHAIEEWADESLYWYGVYYRWRDAEGRADAPRVFPKGIVGQVLLPAVIARKGSRQLDGQGTGRKSAEHVGRDLGRHLSYLTDLLGDRSFLLEDRPMLCDFAVCGQLVYLGRTPRGARALAEHPALEAFLDRMRAQRSRS